MDSEARLYIERAGNELRLGKAVFNLSSNEKAKIELGANPDDTFYSAVISHCYYSIFYSAKAYLLSKGVRTSPPEEHRKTYEAFAAFVRKGVLDRELLRIYDDLLVKADELLSLFSREKWKRGHYTYKTIAQANIPPAEESLANSVRFLSNINRILGS
ncbi:MAG: HEPN domain-containing protein [Candidatus Aenigmarchaeota archaeon]|nr:HEPN domain-containing protein [Candidatus Aenigmarchaeota archaeon]